MPTLMHILFPGNQEDPQTRAERLRRQAQDQYTYGMGLLDAVANRPDALEVGPGGAIDLAPVDASRAHETPGLAQVAAGDPALRELLGRRGFRIAGVGDDPTDPSRTRVDYEHAGGQGLPGLIQGLRNRNPEPRYVDDATLGAAVDDYARRHASSYFQTPRGQVALHDDFRNAAKGGGEETEAGRVAALGHALAPENTSKAIERTAIEEMLEDGRFTAESLEKTLAPFMDAQVAAGVMDDADREAVRASSARMFALLSDADPTRRGVAKRALSFFAEQPHNAVGVLMRMKGEGVGTPDTLAQLHEFLVGAGVDTLEGAMETMDVDRLWSLAANISWHNSGGDPLASLAGVEDLMATAGLDVNGRFLPSPEISSEQQFALTAERGRFAAALAPEVPEKEAPPTVPQNQLDIYRGRFAALRDTIYTTDIDPGDALNQVRAFSGVLNTELRAYKGKADPIMQQMYLGLGNLEVRLAIAANAGTSWPLDFLKDFAYREGDDNIFSALRVSDDGADFLLRDFRYGNNETLNSHISLLDMRRAIGPQRLEALLLEQLKPGLTDGVHNALKQEYRGNDVHYEAAVAQAFGEGSPQHRQVRDRLNEEEAAAAVAADEADAKAVSDKRKAVADKKERLEEINGWLREGTAPVFGIPKRLSKREREYLEKEKAELEKEKAELEADIAKAGI